MPVLSPKPSENGTKADTSGSTPFSLGKLFSPTKLNFSEALDVAGAGSMPNLVDSKVQGALTAITQEEKHQIRVGLMRASRDGIDEPLAGFCDQAGRALVREKGFGVFIGPEKIAQAQERYAAAITTHPHGMTAEQRRELLDDIKLDIVSSKDYPITKEKELRMLASNEAMHSRLIQLGLPLDSLTSPRELKERIERALHGNGIQPLGFKTNKDVHEFLSDCASVSYLDYDAIRILTNHSLGVRFPGYQCSQSFCAIIAKQFLSAKINDPDTSEVDQKQAKAGLSMISSGALRFDQNLLAEALGKDGLDFIKSQYQAAGRAVYGAVKEHYLQN